MALNLRRKLPFWPPSPKQWITQSIFLHFIFWLSSLYMSVFLQKKNYQNYKFKLEVLGLSWHWMTELLNGDAPHLGFRRGLQVTQAVPQTLGAQTELAVLLLNAGDTLQNHLIILREQRQTTTHRFIEHVYMNTSNSEISAYYNNQFPGLHAHQ